MSPREFNKFHVSAFPTFSRGLLIDSPDVKRKLLLLNDKMTKPAIVTK